MGVPEIWMEGRVSQNFDIVFVFVSCYVEEGNLKKQITRFLSKIKN